jgi:CRP/FNR family transcriptional regulator, cyclic AMP receptor protein
VRNGHAVSSTSVAQKPHVKSLRAQTRMLLDRFKDRPHLQELKSLSLFRELSFNELRVVDELLHERVYQKDEIVSDVGDPGLGLFFVVSGRVKAVPPPELVKATVVEFGAGEFFGEMALFEDAPRMAQIVALEETRCVVLFRTDFFGLLQKEKNVAVKILFEYARTITRRARRILVGEVQQPGS